MYWIDPALDMWSTIEDWNRRQNAMKHKQQPNNAPVGFYRVVWKNHTELHNATDEIPEYKHLKKTYKTSAYSLVSIYTSQRILILSNYIYS